jgi:hypothetical protein
MCFLELITGGKRPYIIIVKQYEIVHEASMIATLALMGGNKFWFKIFH